MKWFLKKQKLAGSVLFRSTLPPKADEFSYLKELRIDVRPDKTSEDAHWALALRHPAWGHARMWCPRDSTAIPRALIDYDPRLTREEKEELPHAKSQVWIEYEPETGHILRDRKLFLRYLHAVCGTDGVAGVDMIGNTTWSAAAMQEELGHDADMDVQGIFTLHAVTDGGDDQTRKTVWAHSHGLREIGRFEFNLLQPSEDCLSTRTDFCRALAFAILEEKVKLDDEGMSLILGNSPIRFVSAKRFIASTKDSIGLQYRESLDPYHMEGNGVACETEAKGFFTRLLGRGGVRPSALIRASFPDGLLIVFSKTASELMGERARATLGVFRAWQEEFAEFDPKCIVKLGYETDGGSLEKEYPWFEVHGVTDSAVDATCINKPYHISHIQLGQRAMHQAERVFDWMIMLPFGILNPRSMSLARGIRMHLPEMRDLFQKMKKAGEQQGS